MFHQAQPIVPATDWAVNPHRGDVVLFRFPVAEDTDDVEPPKRRPCLVLDIRRRGGECFVDWPMAPRPMAARIAVMR